MTVIAALFPGQGSQSVGMGGEFLSSDVTAQEIFSSADKSLGYSLSNLCLNGPIEELTLTQNAQPAILSVSYIAFTLANIPVQAAAGHSLGEYTALVAAGAISFEDAVALVYKRGSYMQEAVKPGDGKMSAVMGPTEEEIKTVAALFPEEVIEIANLNCPGQIVVAGSAKGIDLFTEEMTKRGGKIIPLNVSAPFHCSLMKPAAERLAQDLNAISFNTPAFSVYANVTGKKIESGDDARELLKQQVCASVRWTDSMVNMLEEMNISQTIEFGAGGVLTKLMKRINKDIARAEVSSPNSLVQTNTMLGR